MARRTAKTSGWVAQKAGDISIRVAESIVRRVGPKQGFGAQLQVTSNLNASGHAPVGCCFIACRSSSCTWYRQYHV